MVPPKDEACATVTGEPQTGFSVGAVLAPARTTAPARRSPSNNNGYCFVLLKYSPLPVLSSSWKPCFLQPLHQLHRWTKIRTQFVFKHVSEKWGEIFRNLRCRFQKFKEFIVHFWNSYGSFFLFTTSSTARIVCLNGLGQARQTLTLIRLCLEYIERSPNRYSGLKMFSRWVSNLDVSVPPSLTALKQLVRMLRVTERWDLFELGLTRA